MIYSKVISMKLDRIIIVNNLEPKSLQAASRMTKVSNNLKIDVKAYALNKLIGQETRVAIKSEIKKFAPSVVFTLGGDGTMLTVIRSLMGYNYKFSGINVGNLGFLTDSFFTSFRQLLTSFAKGEYYSEKRMALVAEIIKKKTGNKQLLVGINDIILRSLDSFHMSEISLQVNDKIINNDRGDGIIISTPTGSTAYSMSNGGPIIAPNINAICITPIAPHYLSHRPLVLDGDSLICLGITKNSRANIHVSNDGYAVVPIEYGDKVLIKKHSKKISLIYDKKYNYFDVLHKKLNWGN